MSKLTPRDSLKQTLSEHLAAFEWQYWIARLVPMMFVTMLTIVLPRILTQSFVVSELGITQEQKLQRQLRSISIKVLARGQNIGSGVLLKRNDRVYTIVTNAHVIQAANAPFQLQTHDGEIYAAALVTSPASQNRDLSILRFQSNNRTYITAKLAITSPKVGDRVWSSGFPLISTESQDRLSKAPWGLEITNGQITHILPIAISGGYAIGFDRGIRKGMSGGPLINQSGELVGINGVHANPLWDTPDILEDGSTVSDALQEQINSASWAIPIEFVNAYLKF
jgi:S1-C subfamily serine protease